MKETNPNKPKRLKLFCINEMMADEEKQTQTGYPSYCQRVIGENSLVFDQNGCFKHDLPIPAADCVLQSKPRRETNPNKPKWHNPFFYSDIRDQAGKQTQVGYQVCFQELAARKGPILEENGCIPQIPPIPKAVSARRSRHVVWRLVRTGPGQGGRGPGACGHSGLSELRSEKLGLRPLGPGGVTKKGHTQRPQPRVLPEPS